MTTPRIVTPEGKTIELPQETYQQIKNSCEKAMWIPPNSAAWLKSVQLMESIQASLH